MSLSGDISQGTGEGPGAASRAAADGTAPTLAPTRVLAGHTAPAELCAVTRDGAVAISSSDDHTARVWRLCEAAAPAVVLVGHRSYVWQCALSDDATAAATASWDGAVRVWDAVSGERQFILRRAGLESARGCALSPDGALLVAAFGCGDKLKGGVVVCDWRNRDVIAEFSRPFGIFTCAMSRDASIIAFTWMNSRLKTRGVEVADRHGRSLRLFNCIGSAGVCLSDSGSRVAVADYNHLRLYDVHSSTEPTTLQGYTAADTVFCAMTPNGSHVVANAPDQSHSVWDANTGCLVAILRGHTDHTRGCAISADGSCIVTCSYDRRVGVWQRPSSPTASDPPPKSLTTTSTRQLLSPLPPAQTEPGAQQKINANLRYDLFISCHNNEELLPGVTSQTVAREMCRQALEMSNGIASIFFDDHEAHGFSGEQTRLEAIMQTRGGGTVLFMVTKDFLTTPWCANELRAILHIGTRGTSTGNGEEFKLCFICFDSSASEVWGQACDLIPGLQKYNMHPINRTEPEDMGNAMANVVHEAWKSDRQTVFGQHAVASFIQVGMLFQDDVTIARLLLGASGDDILTVMNNALTNGGPNFGMYNLELLIQVAGHSSNRMAAEEKRNAVKAYTVKWVDSQRWSWTVARAFGAEYLSPS